MEISHLRVNPATGHMSYSAPFGQWTLTSGWSGVHEIGSRCRSGENSAVSPGGVGLLCVGSSRDGSGTWQVGP